MPTNPWNDFQAEYTKTHPGSSAAERAQAYHVEKYTGPSTQAEDETGATTPRCAGKESRAKTPPRSGREQDTKSMPQAGEERGDRRDREKRGSDGFRDSWTKSFSVEHALQRVLPVYPPLTWDSYVAEDSVKRELGRVCSCRSQSDEMIPSFLQIIRQWTRREQDSQHDSAQRLVLLHGPPGNGKTHAMRIIACEVAPREVYEVNLTALKSTWYNQTENQLRQLLEAINKKSDAIVFIDEVDSFVGTFNRGDRHHAPLLTEFLRWANGVATGSNTNTVICATNILSNCDPAFLSRCATKIEIRPPSQELRHSWWASKTKHLHTGAWQRLSRFEADSFRRLQQVVDAVEERAAGARRLPELDDYLQALEGDAPEVGSTKSARRLPGKLTEEMLEQVRVIAASTAAATVAAMKDSGGWQPIGMGGEPAAAGSFRNSCVDATSNIAGGLSAEMLKTSGLAHGDGGEGNGATVFWDISSETGKSVDRSCPDVSALAEKVEQLLKRVDRLEHANLEQAVLASVAEQEAKHKEQRVQMSTMMLTHAASLEKLIAKQKKLEAQLADIERSAQTMLEQQGKLDTKLEEFRLWDAAQTTWVIDDVGRKLADNAMVVKKMSWWSTKVPVADREMQLGLVIRPDTQTVSLCLEDTGGLMWAPIFIEGTSITIKSHDPDVPDRTKEVLAGTTLKESRGCLSWQFMDLPRMHKSFLSEGRLEVVAKIRVGRLIGHGNLTLMTEKRI